ncbi:HET-domain-containing protein [Sporormia fimetaria CBS 119925]|uniref:HET-domain-containing protein n=1 Tax=Sporormia fimetaria CBS 119925 TaxID=1340428 RepID=A0A6A6V4M0_9PLEO|nr:HET-domain-containing protein [Sporormia fimetaria CBS 119925]
MSACLQTHLSCPKPESGFFPRRVIDLSSQPPKLLVDHDRRDPYVTLSYCWGGPQLQKLRQQRLREYTTALPVDRLPQTILDAFKTTQQLGFRYLWVDSLCILQDSPEDKLTEISSMAKIYSLSALTIVAASATKVDLGFLGPREDFLRDNIRVPFLCKDGSLGTIALCRFPTQTFYHPDDNPIETRAWTSQERLLTNRALIYSHSGLRFACRQRLESSARGTEWLEGYWEPNYINVADSKDASKWRTLVKQYSRRSLSHPSDKLLAIAALARAYGEEEDYLAGLWRHSIVPDLLWNSDCESHTKDSAALHHAPTWSWASTDSRVSWPMVLGDPSRVMDDPTQFEVLSAAIEPRAGNTGYGQISHGRLEVKGCTLRLSAGRVSELGWGMLNADASNTVHTYRPTPLLLTHPSGPQNRIQGQTWSDDPFNLSSFRISFDNDELGRDDLVLVLVFNARHESDPEKGTLCGLVLEEIGSPGQGTARRVGMFEFEVDKTPRQGALELESSGVGRVSKFRALECLQDAPVEVHIVV